ncbi:MAG: hypothetical protein Q8R01_17845 [Ramlibacter sp.]|nr:hypothetical protein [Ramlibacter sp.]
MNKQTPARRAAPLLLALAAAAAQAQSSCDSDGQPQPVGLLERFTSADCETCWTDAATPRPRRGELALDWIVPGSRGDDAPLSAAASRDSLGRMEALGRPAPAQAETVRRRAAPKGHTLRVAHGLAFNGYLGASIELRPGLGGPWKAWLLLVETLPAGTEGSPVARNLVRNALQPAWDGREPLSKSQQRRLFESRPMSIPEGADPKRLRVVGWVEDARGRIRAIAQSRCAAPSGQG